MTAQLANPDDLFDDDTPDVSVFKELSTLANYLARYADAEKKAPSKFAEKAGFYTPLVRQFSTWAKGSAERRKTIKTKTGKPISVHVSIEKASRGKLKADALKAAAKVRAAEKKRRQKHAKTPAEALESFRDSLDADEREDLDQAGALVRRIGRGREVMEADPPAGFGWSRARFAASIADHLAEFQTAQQMKDGAATTGPLTMFVSKEVLGDPSNRAALRAYVEEEWGPGLEASTVSAIGGWAFRVNANQAAWRRLGPASARRAALVPQLDAPADTPKPRKRVPKRRTMSHDPTPKMPPATSKAAPGTKTPQRRVAEAMMSTFYVSTWAGGTKPLMETFAREFVRELRTKAPRAGVWTGALLKDEHAWIVAVGVRKHPTKRGNKKQPFLPLLLEARPPGSQVRERPALTERRELEHLRAVELGAMGHAIGTEAPQTATAFKATHAGKAPESTTVVEAPEVKGSTLTTLGKLMTVVYRAAKGDAPEADYVHKFEAPRPALVFDKKHRLFVLGGGYTIDQGGIRG